LDPSLSASRVHTVVQKLHGSTARIETRLIECDTQEQYQKLSFFMDRVAQTLAEHGVALGTLLEQSKDTVHMKPISDYSSTAQTPSWSTSNPGRNSSLSAQPKSPDSHHQIFSYSESYRDLIAVIQSRFVEKDIFRITKALASIRPSYSTFTKRWDDEDLALMDRCVERSAKDYKDLMKLYSVPTLVCRKIGEIVQVNKEFTLLTGWSREVLLGRYSGINDQTSYRMGEETIGPRINSSMRRERPVFLAEILDDESVIKFYEDFARMAMGEGSGGHGSVMRACKLLKYTADADSNCEFSVKQSISKRKRGGEQLEPDERRTKLLKSGKGTAPSPPDRSLGCRWLNDYVFCWTVRRDCFGAPMVLVFNVRLLA
jgi:hypothetical protein